MLVRCWAALFIVFSATVAGQGQPGRIAMGTASIAGRVLERHSQRPVAGALVTLSSVSPSGNLLAETDEGGRYTFEHLAAGGYRIGVSHPEDARHILGMDFEAPSDPIIRLANREQRTGVDFTLGRGGKITGRVTNARGEALPGARLIAEPVVPDRVIMLMGAVTNEQGEYSLTQLPEGPYRIAATWTEPNEPRTHGFEQRVYFPGVDEARDALIVQLAPGETASKVDIVMRLTTLIRLSGHILRGNGEGSIYAYLLSPENAVRTVTVAEDGFFTTPRVRPGRHTLVARTQAGTSPQAATLTVALSSELSGIQLTLAPTGAIAGRVVADDGSAVSDTLQVAAVLAEGGNEIDPLTRDRVDVGPRGAFELKDIFGERVLRLINLESGWRIDRVLRGRTPVTSLTVESGSTIGDVTIVISRQ